MQKNKNKKSSKKTRMQYAIFAVVGLILYVTGWHTEVIGFVQRGVLATGLMNPDVEEIAEKREQTNTQDKSQASNLQKVDYNLDFIDAAGNRRSLKEFKGKVIFLNFWATWCPPCVAEMPSINSLHEEMGDEVAFVLLSFDKDFEKAKAFDKRKGYNLPIFAPAGKLPSMFQSSALPTTYVIDAEGNLALTHTGMADYSDPKFKKFLESLK
ncbi:TlpA family protein disulfide reductase [Mesonia sediminis]|uniref:TlpA family protein disulfide reductase n=1 Tax=Mesonia sediminis TaxID=1703946 RepID=A0ABW5SAX9_9FLAO